MSIKNISKKFSDFSLENVSDFVNKYLTQIIYCVCFILIVAFVSIFFLSSINKNSDKQIIKYYQSLNLIRENNNEKAISILSEIYNSNKSDENTKTIAGLRLADLLVSQDKKNEAIEIYLNIYNFNNSNLFLKNLSGLTALSLIINQNNQENYQQIEQLISKLNNPENPLNYLVQEQSGLFELQKGDQEKGLSILNNLLKQDIDGDTKERINMVVELYNK